VDSATVEQPPWDPTFFTEGFVPYLMNRANTLWDAQFKKDLRELDISVVQWRVIGVLQGAPGIPLRELVQRTGIDQPTLSRILDQLERRELLQRGWRESDSRYLVLNLTPAGEAMFSRLWVLAWKHHRHGTASLTEDEERTLVMLLRKMIGSLLK